ncbi:MAG: T9SS type A sorting domain-containing protein, partial [Bacteroidia bacterium]|nr:T9SS type A sorting domain-containing protein [Bacteroidia bacterium]
TNNLNNVNAHPNSTVEMNGTMNQTFDGGQFATYGVNAFGNLVINSQATVNLVKFLQTKGSLTVQNGTLNANTQQVRIGGNLINMDTILSTNAIIMEGSTSANIAMTGYSMISNLTLAKSGGAIVTAVDNLTISGTVNINAGNTLNATGYETNFGILNNWGNFNVGNNAWINGNFNNYASGVVNASSSWYYVKGNFVNLGTFNAGTSTVCFDGNALQTYNNPTALYNVKVNNTSPNLGVSLNSDMVISNMLDLTNGNVTTGTKEVRVTNPAHTAVMATNGYVNGWLRRKISGTGAYAFPVGHPNKGKQGIEFNFTTASDADNIRATFYPSTNSIPPSNPIDCSIFNFAPLNNGRFSATAYNADMTTVNNTGMYTCTLMNAGYTNATVVNANWTIMDDTMIRPGTCQTSSADMVVRSGMSGWGTFRTAQAGTISPRLANPELTAEKSFAAIAYPNPFSSELSLNITMPTAELANIVCTNLLGQVVHTQTVELEAGENTIALDLAKLPAGNYTVRISSQAGTVIQKVVKTN